ncbi:1,4-dihydroxy-2-naphthoate octaprenyltransferase [Desulforamulus aeronauticus]|uniref:1,4-dihydroxy-2-naphthoate octaprenyltransferase n=2 Tax=Desulforamulus aeronauticus DSM 10349 TaxID=1121421 RepID=A0A1M6XJQ3_9FIRM|nr:1,4-dihydroxy-2-naphthoate octaprenyltransferase [Desulforamulus aeronauticus]SHL06197.1 1,4-dihydroxy-2-naphthoate prenyltransferase [Desulforamulus aeronauticus DSM 10349]
MIKTWFLAIRPWSFTAAAIPVTLGTVVALQHGHFNVFLFILTFMGGILLQAGTNLTNTYGDYISGVDTPESAATCPQLVNDILKPKQMKLAGIFAFLLAAMIGGYLTYLRGWPILLLGSIGVIFGYTYTLGPKPYKYMGLGSILVFFLMGPCMVIGAYYVQTGFFNWLALWVSLPIGFLVSCILHANDLRDVPFDYKAGIHTLALTLGKKKGFLLYYFLNIGAFLSLILLLATQKIPLTALLPILLIPGLVKIIKQTSASWQGNNEYLVMLEATAAKFHLQFGLMLIGGFLLDFISRGL